MKKLMEIRVDRGFNLEKAVCNHGFFMTLPNQWSPSSKSLRRPLRLADGYSSVMVSISFHSSSITYSHILISTDTKVADSDHDVIKKQVVRMLRLTNKDENHVRKFQEVHAEPTTHGFGRLFRAPHLFEDIIKALLLCNITWKRTLEMCQYLCELQAELESGMHKCASASAPTIKPRKINDFFRSCKKTTSKVNLRAIGNFPSSKELAGLSEEFLKKRCNLGFRAKYIIQLAQLVEKGELDVELDELNSYEDYDDIRKKMMKLKGIGVFASANILMCMGDYRNIPTDTETIKHLREVHGMEDCTEATLEKDVKKVYDQFAPYQCLAYWYENIESYERKLGTKLSNLSPASYHKVSSSYLATKNNKCITSTKRKRSCSSQ